MVLFLGTVLFILILFVFRDRGPPIISGLVAALEYLSQPARPSFITKEPEVSPALPEPPRVRSVPEAPVVLEVANAAESGAELPSDPEAAVLATSGEEEARNAMQRIFNQPFPKVRPVWLLNSTSGRRLELDMYSEALCIAVEYDGEQHSVWPNTWHKTRAEFEAQQHRDVLKNTLCALQGVTLIRVPHTVKRKDIEPFLRGKLAQLGKLPE